MKFVSKKKIMDRFISRGPGCRPSLIYSQPWRITQRKLKLFSSSQARGKFCTKPTTDLDPLTFLQVFKSEIQSAFKILQRRRRRSRKNIWSLCCEERQLFFGPEKRSTGLAPSESALPWRGERKKLGPQSSYSEVFLNEDMMKEIRPLFIEMRNSL